MTQPSKELKDTLWRVASKPRGSLSAGQYQDVVLGLVFLKYVSDYPGIFAVPANARGKSLMDNTKAGIGLLVDDATDALMTANAALPQRCRSAYEDLDQRRLGELVHLLDSTRFSGQDSNCVRDLMGDPGNFARAEGRRSGEFFTPPSVVRVIGC